MKSAAPLLLALATALPLGAQPKAEGWIELETPHFTVVSAVNKASTQSIARRLEKMRTVFAQITSFDLDPPVPTFVFVFSSRSQFQPYQDLYRGKSTDNAGYFMQRPDANYIAVVAERFANDAVSVVYHEYVHSVTSYNLPELPVWFNEGLAEYFSTFSARGDEAVLGTAVRSHLAWLRRSPLLPLPELFAVDRDSPVYNEGTRRGTFYAQSWLLTHYLLAGNEELQGRLPHYLALLRLGLDSRQAFDEAFGVDAKRLANDLAGYARRPVLPTVSLPIREVESESFPVRPLERAETLGRLGEFLSQIEGRADAAAEHFHEALRLSADDPRALAGLAYLAELRDDRAAALAYFERATAVETAGPRVYFHFAQMLVLGDHDDAALDAARVALEKSVELNPAFAPAWALLTYTYTLVPDPPPAALEAAETAHRMLPADHDVTRNLLRLHSQIGDWRSIEELVENDLKHRDDPWLLAEARSMISNARIREARELAREDHDEEAQALLEELRAEVQDLEKLGQVENELSRLREDFGGSSFAARYNQAFLLVGSGRREEAEAILRELVAEGDGDDAERARDLLAEIDTSATTTAFLAGYNRAVELYNAGSFGDAVRVLEKLLPTLPESGPEREKTRELLEKARRQAGGGP